MYNKCSIYSNNKIVPTQASITSSKESIYKTNCLERQRESLNTRGEERGTDLLLGGVKIMVSLQNS